MPMKASLLGFLYGELVDISWEAACLLVTCRYDDCVIVCVPMESRLV